MRLRQLKLPGRVRLLTDRVPAISQSCHNGAVRPQVTWLLSSGHHLSVFVANISKCYPKEQMNFYLRLDMFHSNSCSVTVLLRSPRNVDLFRQVLSLKYQESVHVMLRSRVPAVAHHLDGPSMLTPGRLAERSGRLTGPDRSLVCYVHQIHSAHSLVAIQMLDNHPSAGHCATPQRDHHKHPLPAHVPPRLGSYVICLCHKRYR